MHDDEPLRIPSKSTKIREEIALRESIQSRLGDRKKLKQNFINQKKEEIKNKIDNDDGTNLGSSSSSLNMVESARGINPAAKQITVTIIEPLQDDHKTIFNASSQRKSN